MKVLSSPAVLAAVAFIISVSTIVGFAFWKWDALFPPKKLETPRFPSLVFDPDASSYSPAETHAMDQLSKELEAARHAILEKESELNERERILDSAARDLAKGTEDLVRRQKELETKITGYMAGFEKVSASEEKNLKKIAQTIVELPPKGAVSLIKQYDKDNNIDQIVKMLEYLKPGEIAPIFDEMMKEDDDASTKLVGDITERLRLLFRDPTASNN